MAKKTKEETPKQGKPQFAKANPAKNRRLHYATCCKVFTQVVIKRNLNVLAQAFCSLNKSGSVCVNRAEGQGDAGCKQEISLYTNGHQRWTCVLSTSINDFQLWFFFPKRNDKIGRQH